MTEASEATRRIPDAGVDAGADWVKSAVARLRRRLWLVAALAAMTLLGAIIYLRSADYTFTAVMRVAPAPTTARESANIGALTSLATLTGATLEAIPVTPFRLYIEAINSREVARRMAEDDALMHAVFADEWDTAARVWRQPADFGASLRNGVLALAGAPPEPWTPPDAKRLQQWIGGHIGIDQTPKTPIVTISARTLDRDLGVAFLGRLHDTADAWLRERTLVRTTSNISYLTRRLPSISLADHRMALIATLNEQEQRLMLVRNPAAYAAERFGPITASPQPTSPRQLPTLVIALVLGSLVGGVAALVLPSRQRR